MTVRVVSYTENVSNICAAAKASHFEAIYVLCTVQYRLNRWDLRPVPSGIRGHISVMAALKFTYI